MKKLKLIFLLTVCLATASIAQDGWKWPQEVDIAKERNALYVDALRSKDYATAIEPLGWLLEKCPDLNESIYINGIKIYQGLEDETKEDAKKIEYQAMVMKLYDDRIKYFGNEASVLNRKAYDAYKYYKSTQNKYQELLDLFRKTYQLNGNDVLDNNLVAYMDVVRRFKQANGNITEAEILDAYGVISDIISWKLNEDPKKRDFLERTQENVDKMLTMVVEVNCEFVEKNLAPKMRETKDSKLAKKVFQLLLTAKCADSPVFVETAELVFLGEPSFGIAKVVATKYAAADNFGKALEWYDKAIALTEDNLDKADIYMSMAQMYANQGRKADARTNAKKALSADPSLTKAYTLIGNLYFSSFNDCKKDVSRVDDRLVFIAAYTQYARAGNSEMMQKAKEQFPTIGEIFELGLEEGRAMTVGCWINEPVILEKRP